MFYNLPPEILRNPCAQQSITKMANDSVREAVLTASNTAGEGKSEYEQEEVKGFDWDAALSSGSAGLDELLKSYRYTGFQATSVGKAIEEINRMLHWRMSDEPVDENEYEELKSFEARNKIKCTIFLGYTSNLVSSGLRETIKFLVKHSLVQAIVTSAGGVEEDFIKCLAPTYLGDFSMSGPSLRMARMNRIGNLVVPNDNYCKFEEWILPILDKMVEEQKNQGTNWTPSKIIDRLGKEINHEDSIYYWAHKNQIPVFCPALTDGSLGDMIYFHHYRTPGLVVDIAEDIRTIVNLSVRSKHTGMIILGGGVVKHHICNANLFRNGADYSVFINTGQEFDGSDAGARPDEAISWGKIKINAQPVKVYAEATLVFPLIVSQTFYKYLLKEKK
ncbi:hypothetical protein PROFUN_14967 [Planoprotostelium fungivorum]|uniref:deoxyhypusine synthase n=1 Tax=Planoprotostelium fungivorum TaxID=1890364 RepID=A0A2P6MY53_9EUKA|nr:hypothetical protein PROFUN_14967 [Planoprotostelium fungivorum]